MELVCLSADRWLFPQRNQSGLPGTYGFAFGALLRSPERQLAPDHIQNSIFA